MVGNWGTWATIVLRCGQDRADQRQLLATPTIFDLSSTPVTAVRLDAVITDTLVAGANSNVTRAEGFIDTVGRYRLGLSAAAARRRL